MVPDGCDGTRLFTPYDAPDGGSIDYFSSNEIVMVAIDDLAANYRCSLLGPTDAGGTSFGMIHEYLKSRRNMREETDMETEFPDDDGIMNSLFATAEELADNIVGAVDDYNISRPYTEANAEESVLGAQVTAATTNYRETFSAPLGLLKFTGTGVFTDLDVVYH